MKQTYQKMNERIVPDQALINRMVDRARKRDGRWALHIFVPRMAAVVAALVLCVGVALPALANGIPQAYQWLYAVSPTTAQYFKKVEFSSEDNGIRMEVLSARIEGEIAQIYLSLQDVSGENRLDETTDLFDSYRIRTAFDCSSTCSVAGYDSETGILTYLITIEQMGGNVEGDKITFSVSELLTGKQEIGMELPKLRDIWAALQTQVMELPEGRRRGGSYSTAENKMDLLNWLDHVLPLRPGDSMIPLTDGVWLSAVGEVDGQLHVQVYYENILETDNHGWVYFLDEQGNQIQDMGSISFWDEEYRGSYDEEVFDMSAAQLMDCALYGEFTTCDTLITGDWEVTFPIEGAD